MGRRYYCDFCDKYLPPGLNHRKTHQQSTQHLQNKRNYYREHLSDPFLLLSEEQNKRPCHQWIQMGTCSYGEKCKYSHRTNEQLIQIIEQCVIPPSLPHQPVKNIDIHRWIEKKIPDARFLPESLV